MSLVEATGFDDSCNCCLDVYPATTDSKEQKSFSTDSKEQKSFSTDSKELESETFINREIKITSGDNISSAETRKIFGQTFGLITYQLFQNSIPVAQIKKSHVEKGSKVYHSHADYDFFKNGLVNKVKAYFKKALLNIASYAPLFGRLAEKESYQLQDLNGRVIAHSASTVGLSWSSIKSFAFLDLFKADSSGKDFDVWDETGSKIGIIDGQGTIFGKGTSDSVHYFKTTEGAILATADHTGNSVTITDHNNKLIGNMLRENVFGVKDHWKVNIISSCDPVLEKMINLYAAFRLQHQGESGLDT